MPKYIPLFVWWIITLAVGSVAGFLESKGVPKLVYDADVTHITQIIAGIAIISNFYIGLLAWKYATARNIWPASRIMKHMKGIWFYATQLFLWGILGTIMGSMFLFYSSFGSLGAVAGLTLATVVPHVLPALGIVFATTGLGVAGVILLSNQLFWFTTLSGVREEANVR